MKSNDQTIECELVGTEPLTYEFAGGTTLTVEDLLPNRLKDVHASFRGFTGYFDAPEGRFRAVGYIDEGDEDLRPVLVFARIGRETVVFKRGTPVRFQ